MFVCVFGFKPTKVRFSSHLSPGLDGELAIDAHSPVTLCLVSVQLEIHNMLSGDPTTERGRQFKREGHTVRRLRLSAFSLFSSVSPLSRLLQS